MPLPLKPQCVSIKFITFSNTSHGILTSDIRFCESGNRLSYSIAILVLTHHRPIVNPTDWLKMNDTSIGSFILEVHKPRLTIGSIYQPTLMRSVHQTLSL